MTTLTLTLTPVATNAGGTFPGAATFPGASRYPGAGLTLVPAS